jgi:4-hydroxybenzoate polyprenyltransferase
LKNIPLLDLFCISSGFLLRAIAGGLSSNIILSQWFLLTIVLLAFFLAVEKRKSELIQFQSNKKMTRKVIKKYSLPLLLRMESLSANSAFISYALWATGPLLNGATNRWMIITVPIVLYGIFRYQLLSDPNQIILKRHSKVQLSAQNPEEILLKDKGIQFTIILWLIITLVIFKS